MFVIKCLFSKQFLHCLVTTLSFLRLYSALSRTLLPCNNNSNDFQTHTLSLFLVSELSALFQFNTFYVKKTYSSFLYSDTRKRLAAYRKTLFALFFQLCLCFCSQNRSNYSLILLSWKPYH